VISQDSYYKETSNLSYEERTKINFDHPRAIDFELLIAHLKDLKAGKIIEQPIYSFITHNRTEDTISTHPRKVVIVEGILIFTNPEIRDLFDIKVFVHADSDERLIRRLKRDIAERGRDMDEVLNRYQTTLKPMHEQFIEPTKAFADIIIPNDKYNTVAIDVVRAVINQRIDK
jgi:uridine kinase